MTDVLGLLKGVHPGHDGWTARCPAHDDKRNSLSVSHRDGKWLLHCHAGCTVETITAALAIAIEDLFDPGGREGVVIRFNNRATGQPQGLTLAKYAQAKQLPIESLRELGLGDVTYERAPAVRIPYRGTDGTDIAVRFRIGLTGDRFRWKSGAKPHLYGLDRLSEARAAGSITVVEGESDCHTLWHHGIPAVGLPGAANWREDRDAKLFDGVATIFVVIEPDKGGETVRKWLAQSAIRSRVRLLERLPGKDPSAMHIADPAGFKQAWQIGLLGAVPWMAVEAKERAEEQAEAWAQCKDLAHCQDILAELDAALARVGLVGERRNAKLLYLAVTSRLLDRPVSLALKGPSSGGKSFVVESVLRCFPKAAFYDLTAMSDRALAYSTEPLQHRHLVIYEAAGMSSDFATYLIRSLLSEGRVRYETVEKTPQGLQARVIEREGPTGLIVTTTSVKLHPENETRMLSLTVTDTREQTAAVFRALADDRKADFDLSPWHALQTWLAMSLIDVVVPFGPALAGLVPPVAVRLRRDFKTLLSLICAHALLHQANRRRDDKGRLIADIADYAAVRELVADLVAEGAEVTIAPVVRATVSAVAQLLAPGKTEVMQADLKKALKLDKSVVSRRVASALDLGVLRNLEERKGKPARLVLGDAMPDEIEVLPKPERLRGCTVDEGGKHLPSPHGNRCHFCQQGERDDDPLLEAAVGGEQFVAHRSCLDKAWQAIRESQPVDSTSIRQNGKTDAPWSMRL